MRIYDSVLENAHLPRDEPLLTSERRVDSQVLFALGEKIFRRGAESFERRPSPHYS